MSESAYLMDELMEMGECQHALDSFVTSMQGE